MVAKYADHLPLYCQHKRFAREGITLPQAEQPLMPSPSWLIGWIIDNNHIEQQIRPLALGRKNWLFAGSLRAGQRAAAIMTLIQSAKLNGHDPLAYLGDILQRLPTQPNHQIHELLPHHWITSVTKLD